MLETSKLNFLDFTFNWVWLPMSFLLVAADGEKMSKMKHLLDLLSNPAKRTQIETLNKCEIVLDKLDFARVSFGNISFICLVH